MKVLVLFEYPPLPAGLSTQGDLLVKGLQYHGVDVYPVHLKSTQEKEWYCRWFAPDIAVGVGYWGYTPHIVQHPQQCGILPVPWLVADGYIANYRDVLNGLPLILVTSTWVKEVYTRDGVNPEIIEVLPVGCDTDMFVPREQCDPKVAAVREAMGVAPDEIMILTIGGDAASKGSQEVMQALAMIKDKVPAWKYVCKVWPQPRTERQNRADQEMAERLGIADRVVFATGKVSRNFMPYLIAACDIYAGPSRLEGFGMPHVESGACGKPVVAINAMAFRDTLVHGETALLAGVAKENWVYEAILDEEAGFPGPQRIVFDPPRIGDYRASVEDIAQHLLTLMADPALCRRMGEAGRQRAVAEFDYRVVGRKFVEIVSRRLPAIAERSREQAYSLSS
ncbi:MAG: glycosyltransferase family 4 protein [Armatimonadota bacterium]